MQKKSRLREHLLAPVCQLSFSNVTIRFPSELNGLDRQHGERRVSSHLFLSVLNERTSSQSLKTNNAQDRHRRRTRECELYGL